MPLVLLDTLNKFHVTNSDKGSYPMCKWNGYGNPVLKFEFMGACSKRHIVIFL